ncbi:MAG: dihydrolipoyl dehydrogenase [Bdellovibrionales bacterium]|nr:dihydrolipoyl dehydrogenase [Bdellovibrionales bacterium]
MYDLVVIGGGPAGYVGAIRAAQLGMKVACIERRKKLGGTCLNVGCIPSKALLDATENFYAAKVRFPLQGIFADGLRFDLGGIMKHKDSVVNGLAQGVDFLFRKNKIDRFLGTGRLKEKRNEDWIIEVSDNDIKKDISAKRVLIATGSEVVELPFLKFNGQTIVSSTEALSFSEVPKHLVVIGGGFIGLEMGSVWLRLGAKVTIIEAQDRILAGGVDKASAQELYKSLEKQGMTFLLSTKCHGAKNTASGVAVVIENAEGKRSELECDRLLVAVGRRPYSESLGVESFGVEVDSKRRIKVNKNFETNVTGLYAVGDVIEGPMLAHKASEEAVAAVELMAGRAGHVNYQAIPSVVYTTPELAAVGRTEEELVSEGVPYKVGTFPFSANARARSLSDTEGLIRVLAHASTDQILGVHIVGPRASEMIPHAVSVMEFSGSAEDVARTCHAHPTLPEVFKEACLDVDKRRLHL